MSKFNIIPYNPKLKPLAKILRSNSTLGEILLWLEIKNRALGYLFNRQVPLDNYIVDFFCKNLKLAIEIDGSSHDHKYDADLARTNNLENYGITIIRFDEKEVRKNMDNVLRVIGREIKKIEEHPPDPLQRGRKAP